MKSFEEKRENYFNEMKNDFDFFMSVMSNKGNQNQDAMKILFTPKNEQELEIATTLYMYISDEIKVTKKLFEESSKDRNEWKPEESPFTQLYEILIKGLSKDGTIDKNIIDPVCNYRGKESAVLLYDMITVFLVHPSETFEYLAKKCVIDLEDELSVSQFNLYSDRIKEYIDTNSESPVTSINDETAFKHFKIFAEEFHKLCSQDKEKGPKLLKKTNFNK